MRKFYLFLLMFFCVQAAKAQIAAWDFTGEANVATSAAEVYNSNLDASNLLTRGTGAAASAGANSFRTVGFQNNGISTANTDYFQFTISSSPGFTVSLSTIDARFNGTATFFATPGVTSQFAYSLDGNNFTLIGSPQQSTSLTLTQIDLSGIAELQNVAEGTTVTFRYYASGQTTTGGWGFNSPAAGAYGLAIGGSVTPASGGNSNTSDIITNAGFIAGTNINYANFQAADITAGNSVEIGQFTIRDGGASADADAVGTTLTNLSLAVSNSANIRRIALYDGSTEIAEVAGGATAAFTSLSLAATDGGSKTFSVRVTYNSTVTDNQQNVVTVSSATADVAGSTFAAGNAGAAASSSAGDDNRVEVTADRLAFVQQPTSTGTNAAMTPAVTVSANDANGNRDLDFTSDVRITSTGTLAGSPVDAAAIAGLATFSTLTHTANGSNLTLNAERAAGGDWDVTSTSFNISAASSAGDQFRSKTSGNWASIATWETSSDGNTWQDATLIPNENASAITIRNGHNVTVAAAAIADEVTVDAGATLTWSSNFTLVDGTGTDLSVNGTVVNTAGTITTTGASISFGANSLYQHARNGSPVPSATWNLTSTVEVTGANSTQPSNLAQTFGNFTWNVPTQTQSVNLSGGLTNVAGNFTVTSTSNTANRVLRFFATTQNATVTIGGDLILNSVDGKLEFSNGNATNSVLNLGGNLVLTAGSFSPNVSGALAVNFTGTNKTFQTGGTLNNSQINWNVPGTASLTLLSNLPVAASRLVTIDGTLTTGLNQITGAGGVTVNGTLATENLNGVEGTIAATGTVTLGAASTINFMASTGTQAITARSDYQNVIISGGSAKTAVGASTINGVLALNSGIVTTTATDLITLTANASFTGGSNGSFIAGPLVRQTNATTAYTYPTGKGSAYKPFDVIPASTDASSFGGEYFAAAANTANVCDPARLQAYTGNEYWDVQRAAGTANAQVRLNYSQAVSNGTWTNGAGAMPNPDATKRITIAHFNGTCWQDEVLGTGVIAGNATSGQVTSKVVSSFSPFTFGYSPFSILPVHFTSVKATQKANGIQVEWTNSTEENVVSYTIERSSNGRSFAAVAQLNPTRNDGGKASYSFVDATPLTSDNFYRIRSSENNGKIVYSTIVRINPNASGTGLVLYPNPVKGNELGLQISKLPAGKYSIRIFNAQGQEVSARQFNHAGGALTESLSIGALQSGIYSLQIAGEVSLQKQFIKE